MIGVQKGIFVTYRGLKQQTGSKQQKDKDIKSIMNRCSYTDMGM